ncbi:MAG: hypothetical protein GY757_40405 [bacterium]|nr:hypothetical protein [bacterium]
MTNYMANPALLKKQDEKERNYIIENFNRGKIAEKYMNIFREITGKTIIETDNEARNSQ